MGGKRVRTSRQNEAGRYLGPRPGHEWTWGTWLRVRRAELQKTQQELADDVGLNRNTIKRIENRPDVVPRLATLKRLASVVGPLPEAPPVVLYERSDVQHVGVVDWEQMPAWETVLETETFAECILVTTQFRKLFGLRVKDDSMHPALLEGDLVAVAADASVSNGDFVVFLNLRTKECDIRSFRRYGKTVILQALKPGYPDLELPEDTVRVIGRVLEVRRRLGRDMRR